MNPVERKAEIEAIKNQNNIVEFINFVEHDSKNNKKAIFTICNIRNRESKELLARGIAICSVLDNFVKKTAKHISLGRAMKALVRKKNDEMIRNVPETAEIPEYLEPIKTARDIFTYKSEYKPSEVDVSGLCWSRTNRKNRKEKPEPENLSA